MFVEEEDFLAHYGILRKSGRYPWGSGDTEGQRNKDFLATVHDLTKKGLSQVEIAQGFGMTTTQLRAAKTIAINEQKQATINEAKRLRDKGMSNSAIGRQMGKNESTIRSLLSDDNQDRVKILDNVSNMLKDQVSDDRYLDIGTGVEVYIGVARPKLNAAIAKLKDEDDYTVHYIQVEQLGTGPGKKTTMKVLAPPGITTSEVYKNLDRVKHIEGFSEDGGRSSLGLQFPKSFDSQRLMVRYKEDGGADSDGVIFVRPGVPDVSLGQARYAQVRIAVDGSHYIKGMAMYKPDLPDGVDLVFNTNKSNTGNKLDALKPFKTNPDGTVDQDNPFGSQIRRQLLAIDKDGKEYPTSVMNLMTEEGQWDTWSKTLSSQFLSKQNPKLATEQLATTYENKLKELDEIMSLTNPTVKRTLLEKYADSTDADSVHLKAASLPRQSTHVILPINSLKDTEIYAPNFNNGESVVLVRHPHGGIFEIPQLTVNNKNREGRSLIGTGPKTDAVGINSKVASHLSGADFDGDHVLVIPNSMGKVKTAPILEGLKDFDPKASFPPYPGMKAMTPKNTQAQMGIISNLITDMTIRGASDDELARAVRHSMVIIDAEKHKLDYKASAVANNIRQLHEKYQGSARGGASTLISRAGSETRITERVLRPAKEGGPIDPLTGKKVYVDRPNVYVNRQGKTVERRTPIEKLALTEDAQTLVSEARTQMEIIYANHSNRLKSLANQARKETLSLNNIPYSPAAKKAYASEVESLNAKLRLAQRNKPLERQAQLIGNATVSAKRAANPNMDKDELKKVTNQALAEARRRTGADKQDIRPTPEEWAAIQAGAISGSKLESILSNSDIDHIKKLAMPRTTVLMTPIKTQRARSMMASGYTQSEIAAALGVSLTTLKNSIGSGS